MMVLRVPFDLGKVLIRYDAEQELVSKLAILKRLQNLIIHDRVLHTHEQSCAIIGKGCMFLY